MASIDQAVMEKIFENGGRLMLKKTSRKTSPCNEDPLTPHFYMVKLGFTGVYIIFLFLL